MGITVWMDVESRIDKFFCLSTDDKPTGVPTGSILYTTDTLVWYVTYNGTDWVEKKSEGIDIAGIDAVIDDEAILAAVAVVDGIVDDILEDTIDIQSTVDDVETDVATVDTVVDAIKVVTDALATLTETGGTVASSGAETDIYINNAPSGVFKPIALKIDFTNHTAAETVMVTEYYRIKSGGAWLKEDYVVFEGAQDFESIVVDLNPNRYGVKVTIEKGAGSDRNYDWEVFYEI